MKDSKKITLKILLLYVVSSFIFLGIVFYGWFLHEKKALLREKILLLHQQSHLIMSEFYAQKKEGKDFEQSLKEVSKNTQIPFALVDKNALVYFSSIKTDLDFLKDKEENKAIFDSKNVFFFEDFIYLLSKKNGARFTKDINKKHLKDLKLILVVQTDGIKNAINKLFIVMGLAFLFSIFIISIIAYFLVKLSLKPLDEKIDSLNAFIKDSTHEINTPLSVILMSAERISENLNSADKQKIERIKLAAKSLSRIYSDLVFLNFPHTQKTQIELLNLKIAIQERIAYFAPFFMQKNITLHQDLQDTLCKIDKNHLIRILDNLLSNALKYTQNDGYVKLILKDKCLNITNSGKGLQNTEKIFERYYRLDCSQGGFGIGLALIKQICDLYKITLTCKSILDKENSFTLDFSKLSEIP